MTHDLSFSWRIQRDIKCAGFPCTRGFISSWQVDRQAQALYSQPGRAIYMGSRRAKQQMFVPLKIRARFESTISARKSFGLTRRIPSGNGEKSGGSSVLLARWNELSNEMRGDRTRKLDRLLQRRNSDFRDQKGKMEPQRCTTDREKTSNREREMGACKTGTEAFCFLSGANIKVGRKAWPFLRPRLALAVKYISWTVVTRVISTLFVETLPPLCRSIDTFLLAVAVFTVARFAFLRLR